MASFGATAANPERRSNPVIANFTLVGSPTATGADGITINTGSQFRVYNGVATNNHATAPCLDIDNTPDSTAIFRSVFFSCNTSFASDVDTVEEATIFGAGTNNNTAGGTSSLTNTFVNGANESSVPATSLVTLSDTELQPSLKAFLTSANYIGAVRDGADTWWQGWTCGLGGGPAC